MLLRWHAVNRRCWCLLPMMKPLASAIGCCYQCTWCCSISNRLFRRWWCSCCCCRCCSCWWSCSCYWRCCRFKFVVFQFSFHGNFFRRWFSSKVRIDSRMFQKWFFQLFSIFFLDSASFFCLWWALSLKFWATRLFSFQLLSKTKDLLLMAETR